MAVSLNRVVSGTVNRIGQAIQARGFGTPAGLHQLTNVQQPTRYAAYASLQEMTDAGIPTSSTAYEWASIISSQEPSPERWVIGRRGAGVAQVETVTITVVEDGEWFLNVDAVPTYKYIASGGATDVEIAVGLHAQILADQFAQITVDPTPPVAANFNATAKIAGDPFTLTITPPGGPGAGTVVNVTPNTVAEDVSDALDAVEAESDDFYRFTIDTRNDADILKGALWAAARRHKKFFFAQSSDPDMRVVPSGSSIGDQLNALSYGNTFLLPHKLDGTYLDAGVVGRASGADMDTVGQRITYATLQIIGVPVDDINDTELTNIDANHGNGYVQVTGAVPSTFNGKVVNGDFADLEDVDAWFLARTQESIGAFILNANVVSFDNAGIAGVKGAALSVANRGAVLAHFTPEVPPVVTAPSSHQILPADKAARILRDVKVTATYSGAIHSVTFVGSFSI